MALNNYHPWMQWIIGTCLGLTMGTLTGLLSILLIQRGRRALKYLSSDKVRGFQLDRDRNSAQALALLKNQSLSLEQLPVLGSGGVATVYKGTLANGTHVAIKKIPLAVDRKSGTSFIRHSSWWSTRLENTACSSAGLGQHHALSELGTSGKVRHSNLSRMYAYCRTSEAHLLAYQLAENGSLEDVLRKVREGSMTLDWLTRKSIALGIARGLQYLHDDCSPSIIHRDLKTSNILLDKNFTALLSDFGLAWEIAEDVTHVTVSKIVGTAGYYAPEYGNTGRFSMASDVYSMGVVFGVLLSGREPRDEFFTDVEGGMIGWIDYLIKRGQEHRAVDSTIPVELAYVKEMKSLLWIAFHCTRTKPADRPTSKAIVTLMLRSFFKSQPKTIPTTLELIGGPAWKASFDS